MSDLERLNLKALPPVEPLAGWPSRYSQTLLKKADTCLRSAYLYVRYHGGTPGHQLDRGSLGHAVFQRMNEDLVAADAESYIEPEFTQDAHGLLVEEDPETAARQIASMTAAIVDEVARERTDLVVPFGELDAVRAMAYHFAIGWRIKPSTVVGIERKFVMDVAGHEVSGIIDFCSIDGRTGEVDDYKTSWNRPEQDDYEKGFQGRLYALLLVFGFPVERVECLDCDAANVPLGGSCPTCGGRGWVEERLPPIGQHLQHVRTRELYPRFVETMMDGSVRLQQRENTLSRTQLQDFRHDLERAIAQLDQAHDTWLFPAVPGHHCGECPAASECPLPAHLREYAGAIDSPERASASAAWADLMSKRVADVNAEVKRWAGEHGGRVRYGVDLVREFVSTPTTSVRKAQGRADWDGMLTALRRAAELGEEFDEGFWIKRSSTNNFKKRTLSAEELAAEQDHGGGNGDGAGDRESLEKRFGVEPPF